MKISYEGGVNGYEFFNLTVFSKFVVLFHITHNT